MAVDSTLSPFTLLMQIEAEIAAFEASMHDHQSASALTKAKAVSSTPSSTPSGSVGKAATSTVTSLGTVKSASDQTFFVQYAHATDTISIVSDRTGNVQPTVLFNNVQDFREQSHKGHPLTHLGTVKNTNGGQVADFWYCQRDHIICVG